MSRYTAPAEFTEGVAARLHRLRIKAGLTQERAAEELEIPFRSLTNHESGDYGHGLHTIARYARFYGVSLDEIIGGLLDRVA